MKASELTKRSKTVEEIIEDIKVTIKSNPCQYKYFLPHWIYVSNEVQVELSMLGFKMTHGATFNMDYGLIIEW